MRILSVFVGLVLASLRLQQAPQFRPELPASVDGIVIDSQTKQPLAGATILILDRSGSGAQMITVTGNDGRFAFRSVPAGAATIEASRPGYVSEMAGKPAGSPNLSPNPLVPRDVPIVQE